MKQKSYLHWGVTVTAAACAILVFYDTFFQNGVLLVFVQKLLGILQPVLYGLAMAYLLAPIVNFFDRLFRDRLGLRRELLMRVLSIFVTWLLALGVLYLLFSILIPELTASVRTLFSNIEFYYREVYGWVVRLAEDNPYISERVLKVMSEYYNEMVKWVYNTLIPQAQVAIVAVTGGVMSVVGFATDLLVGIVVSVYVLARKETFARHAKMLLYAALSELHYYRAMSAVGEVNRIFSGFVRGKLLDSLIIGILCFIGCSILKFPYTPIISVFVGVTNVIPIFGPFLGAIPSAFLILLVDPKQCLYFVLFIIALQQFDGNILGPRILGETVGVSSFWIIVAILVGGGFGGVLGMFLGVPIFASIYSAVQWLARNALRKKGIDGEESFDAATAASPPTTTSDPKGENHE